MIVMKFGGTSVESAVAIERVAGIVKTRHWPAIQSECARRDDEIGALEATVTKARHLDQWRLTLEHGFRIRPMRKQRRQMLMEGEIVAYDGRDWSGHRLVDVCKSKVGPETFPRGRRTEEQQPHRLRVHAGRAELDDIVQLAEHAVGNRLVEPAIMRARIQE